MHEVPDNLRLLLVHLPVTVCGKLVGERVEDRPERLLERRALVLIPVNEGEVVEDVADVLARVEPVLIAERYGGEVDVRISHRLCKAFDDCDTGFQLPLLGDAAQLCCKLFVLIVVQGDWSALNNGTLGKGIQSKLKAKL